MSGEAGGLILIPLAVAALPFVLGGLAVYGIARAAISASSAVAQYEQEKRKHREAIRQSGVQDRIGNFRNDIQRNMNEQVELNIKVSESIMSELESHRRAIQSMALENDPATYREYISTLSSTRVEITASISKLQAHFVNDYQNKIAESMAFVSNKINQQYSKYIDELQQMQADEHAKRTKAQEFAKMYIEEANTVIKSLKSDFNGEKFSGAKMDSLIKQFSQTVDNYNKGYFESAIATAKDVILNSLEEIYEADCKKQEWENYYKLALVLSDEVKSYIESQESITKEIKEHAEQRCNTILEDEVVGIRIADYTDKNAQGQSKYDFLLSKANHLHALLRSENSEQLTTQQLKDYVAYLNNDLYVNTTHCINKAVLNMNNAFSRQKIGEEVITFFEEHNFMFNGHSYEDGCHDKSLYIGLQNESTGEELMITLSPTLLNNGEVQTYMELHQVKGDEANEERKEEYRQYIKDVIGKNSPYATVDLKCNKSTLNKLSASEGIKEKITTQQ